MTVRGALSQSLVVVGALVLGAPADAHVPPPAVPIVVHYQACPVDPLASCYFELGGAQVYLAGQSTFTYWHELGHVYDRHNLSDAERDARGARS